MHIAGFKESSLNEWEGYVTSIIWTAGCNWRCAYCHGSHLILEPDEIDKIEEQTIFDFIKDKNGWVDGLCISGGEPTLQPDLIDFIQRARKQLNVAIKLETNGSNPQVIRKLLNDNSLECLCLDFKQLPEKLPNITGKKSDIYEVIDSYNAAFKSEIEIEFHTTLCPSFVKFDDIKPMAEFLHNKGLWILQQYNTSDVLDLDRAGNIIYSNEEIAEIYAEAQKYHKNVMVKNI
jgi:pyruvate formate lyase activating enzyme